MALRVCSGKMTCRKTTREISTALACSNKSHSFTLFKLVSGNIAKRSEQTWLGNETNSGPCLRELFGTFTTLSASVLRYRFHKAVERSWMADMAHSLFTGFIVAHCLCCCARILYSGVSKCELPNLGPPNARTLVNERGAFPIPCWC